MRQEGEIEFLGREDRQVKIRGVRIELGEIEVVLGNYPEVRTVAVVVAMGSTGHRTLTACVAPKSISLKTEDLRAYAAACLPEAFVSAQVASLLTFQFLPQ